MHTCTCSLQNCGRYIYMKCAEGSARYCFHYNCIVCLPTIIVIAFSMCRLKESREQQFCFYTDRLMLWRALQLIACTLFFLELWVISWSTGLTNNIVHQRIASIPRYCENLKLLNVCMTLWMYFFTLQIKQCDDRLLAIQVPDVISRPPRSLQDYSHWKGTVGDKKERWRFHSVPPRWDRSKSPTEFKCYTVPQLCPNWYVAQVCFQM